MDSRNKMAIVLKASRICCFSTLLFFLALPIIPAQKTAPAASRYWIYFGTSTGPESKGIYACSFEPSAERFGPITLVAEVERATWLIVHPNNRYLYSVSEVGNDGKTDGAILGFEINPATGSLKLINRISSGGGGATHLAIDRTEKSILVANFGSGRVAAFRLHADGMLAEQTAMVQHSGSGVHPRQLSPHPHAVVFSPDSRFLFVPDLGLDKVYSYVFNPAAGSLGPNSPAFVQVPPGSGPRHFAFSPDGRFAYLINQMESRITAYSYLAATGILTEIQTITTLPSGFSGTNSGAEIGLDRSGRFLYATNRGDDSVVVFSIDPKKGTLASIQHIATEGKRPRSFSIDPTGKYLFVENQDSNNVTTFRINGSTGELSPAGRVLSVPTPVCAVFVPADK
jgi:6-phosphogluconolactonase